MLTYNFPNKKEKPLYLYLYEFIKTDILSSSLKPNEKLPSKRTLAKQLQISLVTVENAYAQLLIEGYIYSIEKKGYFVEDIGNQKIIKNLSKVKTEEKEEISKNNSLFPYPTWNSLSRKVLSENESIKPSSFKGDLSLRVTIADHLNAFHNMNVSPSSIFLGAGSEYLYSLLIQFFTHNKIYALEDPGHLSISKIYKSNETSYKYIPLDKQGISVKELTKSKANVVHISPAHHFPTGITMPLKRRMELIKWANDFDGYIIEDDYDSEFRFLGRPIPPLYQLDHTNRVIYMNTFSKTLSSTFRIAYLVLPDNLVEEFENKLGFYHNTVSALDQKVLAKFISEGYYERHINRMRKHYRIIHDELITKINSFKDEYNLEIIESESGLHFLIKLQTEESDESIKEKAIKLNFKVQLLSHYMNKKEESRTLVIAYSNLSLDDLEEYVTKLKSLVKSLNR